MPADPAVSASEGARRLFLLRHAKAEPHETEEGDHSRALALPRAAEQMERAGAFLLARTAGPELVLCSDALRTRQTWERCPRFPSGPPEVRLLPSLYLAEAAAILGVLRAAPDAVRTLLVIGHNPGLHALALALAGRARAAETRLADALPTAAVAAFTLRNAPWSALAPESVTGLELHRA